MIYWYVSMIRRDWEICPVSQLPVVVLTVLPQPCGPVTKEGITLCVEAVQNGNLLFDMIEFFHQSYRISKVLISKRGSRWMRAWLVYWQWASEDCIHVLIWTTNVDTVWFRVFLYWYSRCKSVELRMKNDWRQTGTITSWIWPLLMPITNGITPPTYQSLSL